MGERDMNLDLDQREQKSLFTSFDGHPLSAMILPESFTNVYDSMFDDLLNIVGVIRTDINCNDGIEI